MTVLRDAWYAIAEGKAVRDIPMLIEVHGLPLVAFRDHSQNICTFDARCPHRGCDLSLGRVEANHLVCAYHGWQFDHTGQCVHIPANKAAAPIPESYRVKSYPATEAAGLVWVYTGQPTDSTELPPLPLFPELLDDDRFAGIPFSVQWKAHFTRVVESVLDVSHLPFVHPESTGDDILPEVEGPECHVTNNRIVIYPTPFAPSHPMEPVPEEWMDKDSARRTEIELLFPNHWMIRTPVGDIETMCTYLTFTPNHDGLTTIYGRALRDFELENDFLDEFHMEHTTFVMSQDQRIVETQRPAIAPFQLRNELHVASDSPPIRYRKMLMNALQHENRGG